MDKKLMDKTKKQNESEMGSGESDDEFYNVKLPHTPTVAPDKYKTKVEVKKVYSPPRTKIKYDYKFDSSSDDESESKTNEQHSNLTSKDSNDSNGQALEKIENVNKSHNSLPQNTYKVIDKINEELKYIKSEEGKKSDDNTENIANNQNHLNKTLSTGVNISRSAIGVISPVVVMPPPVVVPQAPLINVGPMLVTSPVGMAGPVNMMGMAGNILRSPASLGNIMNPRNSLASSMMGINAVTGQLAGAMAMQSNILNIQGNGIASQGNLMGLRPGMISPVGGMNMMLQLQNPNSNIIGLQNPSTVVGVSKPNTNLIGTSQPVNISGLPTTLMKTSNSGNGVVMTNSGGMMVSPTGVMNNPIASTPGGFMVMGGLMGNSGNSSVSGTGQGSILSNAGNVMGGSNVIRMMGTSPGNPPLRPLPPPPPPPPFLNRNRSLSPANFKWQTSPRSTGGIPQPASPTASKPPSNPSVSSPSSSPVHQSSGQYDGDDLSTDFKEESSDKSLTLEEDDASQSPPKDLPNTFKNDGSFMEIFKKMNDENNQEASSSQQSSESNDIASIAKKPPIVLSGIVGKRRGGRVLKTGLVKKVKKESEIEEEKHPKDAWSMYMAEVKKYREASCEEEGKTRPLVK